MRPRRIEMVETERPVVMDPRPVMPVRGQRIAVAPAYGVEPVFHERPPVKNGTGTTTQHRHAPGDRPLPFVRPRHEGLVTRHFRQYGIAVAVCEGTLSRGGTALSTDLTMKWYRALASNPPMMIAVEAVGSSLNFLRLRSSSFL